MGNNHDNHVAAALQNLSDSAFMGSMSWENSGRLTAVLNGWLMDVAVLLRSGARPNEIQGPFGTHGVDYGEDEDGQYAKVGFCIIPAQDMGWFVEIDDDTFGNMNWFRLYLDLDNYRENIAY